MAFFGRYSVPVLLTVVPNALALLGSLPILTLHLVLSFVGLTQLRVRVVRRELLRRGHLERLADAGVDALSVGVLARLRVLVLLLLVDDVVLHEPVVLLIDDIVCGIEVARTLRARCGRPGAQQPFLGAQACADSLRCVGSPRYLAYSILELAVLHVHAHVNRLSDVDVAGVQQVLRVIEILLASAIAFHRGAFAFSTLTGAAALFFLRLVVPRVEDLHQLLVQCFLLILLLLLRLGHGGVVE